MTKTDKNNKKIEEVKKVVEESLEEVSEKKAKKVKVEKKKVDFKKAINKVVNKFKKSNNSKEEKKETKDSKLQAILLEHKKKTIISIVICVVAIILVIIAIVMFTKPNKEKELNNALESLGRDFYENFYYKQVGSGDSAKAAEFVLRFKTLGIKVSLDNLSRYNSKENEEIMKLFKDADDKYICDKDASRVIIYPKEKYGAKDYDIEVELSCDFLKKDKKETKAEDKKDSKK